MNKTTSTSSRGFTIVELLIVIVVIAILAAISIVAYNGISQRARNNARIAAASQIAKAVNAYVVQEAKELPGIPVCIPTGGKDYSGDSVPDCSSVSVSSGRWSEKTATNTALAAAGFNSFNYPTDEVTATSGAKYAGVAVTYNDQTLGINGTLQPYFVYFWLEGVNQDCSSSLSINTSSNPNPLYRIVPGKNYSSGNGITACAYTIQHSSSL